MMVVLMLGVTLLVALAMIHLAATFSLGESKRDARGVDAMATEATPIDLGTSSTQQAAVDSSPPPPSPAALVQVAVLVVEEIAAPSWAHPILKFLLSKELPTDDTSARQVQRRAAAYTIINRELVRRSVTGVYQCCVEPEQGQAILRDIHQGECGHHAASRALVTN